MDIKEWYKTVLKHEEIARKIKPYADEIRKQIMEKTVELTKLIADEVEKEFGEMTFGVKVWYLWSTIQLVKHDLSDWANITWMIDRLVDKDGKRKSEKNTGGS